MQFSFLIVFLFRFYSMGTICQKYLKFFMISNLHFHLDDCLTRPLSQVDGGGGGGPLPPGVAKPTPVLVGSSLCWDPPAVEVSPGFYQVLSAFCWLPLCFPLSPELVVFLSADVEILAGQPEAVVEMDEDNDEAVVDDENRPGGETGREPLDENEEDVFHNDKEGPEAGDLKRFREVEKISSVFPSITTKYT